MLRAICMLHTFPKHVGPIEWKHIPCQLVHHFLLRGWLEHDLGSPCTHKKLNSRIITREEPEEHRPQVLRQAGMHNCHQAPPWLWVGGHGIYFSCIMLRWWWSCTLFFHFGKPGGWDACCNHNMMCPTLGTWKWYHNDTWYGIPIPGHQNSLLWFS